MAMDKERLGAENDLMALSDEQLVDRYRNQQRLVDGSIRIREGYDKMAGGSGHAEKVQKKGIEQGFGSLNALGREIERRGLKAPTMEDRANEFSQENAHLDRENE